MTGFKTAANVSDAAVQAVTAGLDQDLGEAAFPTLTASVQQGTLLRCCVSPLCCGVLLLCCCRAAPA